VQSPLLVRSRVLLKDQGSFSLACAAIGSSAGAHFHSHALTHVAAPAQIETHSPIASLECSPKHHTENLLPS